MAVRIAGQDIAADARRVFECVRDGGVAIIHLDIAYAVLGTKGVSIAIEFSRALTRRVFHLGALGGGTVSITATLRRLQHQTRPLPDPGRQCDQHIEAEFVPLAAHQIGYA
jgi:hypothetical protein